MTRGEEVSAGLRRLAALAHTEQVSRELHKLAALWEESWEELAFKQQEEAAWREQQRKLGRSRRRGKSTIHPATSAGKTSSTTKPDGKRG